mmetsp:Transcript_20999/g.37190  ORF Transcript_20999/g.37190 Transcript_20999/m.37190 type:complete len:104 (-) Transcript_20999:420-731(-)
MPGGGIPGGGIPGGGIPGGGMPGGGIPIGGTPGGGIPKELYTEGLFPWCAMLDNAGGVSRSGGGKPGICGACGGAPLKLFGGMFDEIACGCDIANPPIWLWPW